MTHEIAGTSAEVIRRIDAAYDAWKDADAKARALLHEVSETWSRHDSGECEPPSSELLGKAKVLNQDAREKLASAIQLLHDAGLIQPSVSSKPRRRLPGAAPVRPHATVPRPLC